MGVDFRPYMQQVLAAVRQNWFAVYPEAARLGQRGEVVLEFAIAKQGLITKVVIFSTESGAEGAGSVRCCRYQCLESAATASHGIQRGSDCFAHDDFMYNVKR